MFDCILNNSCIINEKIDDVNIVIEENQKNIISEQVSLDINNEVVKMKLIGYIQKRNTYFNFFPQFELIAGKLREISSTELKNKFPTEGSFNLAFSTFSSESCKFLENDIDADIDKDNYIRNLYVVDVEECFLEENSDDRYKVKLELQKLFDSGYKLADTIQLAENFGIYKVVFSEFDTIPSNTFNSGTIFLKENADFVKGEMVLLYYDNKYYGPFSVECKIGGRYYIKTGASETDYLVPFFKNEDVQKIELEKAHFLEDNTYTEFVYTLNKGSIYDSITDEMLIEKISDDISLELAKEKPEEFSHLCSNSPFLAKLPQEIIDHRILRLQEIINNVELCMLSRKVCKPRSYVD